MRLVRSRAVLPAGLPVDPEAGGASELERATDAVMNARCPEDR